MDAVWSIQTPVGAPGAIAVIRLSARDAAGLDRALAGLGMAPVTVGEVALRRLVGVDEGIVARWAEAEASLMPHGGPAVVRAVAAGLLAAGVAEDKSAEPEREYPEARSAIEARMLAALARAASPLAIDVLLDQPRRWAVGGGPVPPSHAAALRRLVDPPLVVAIGPPNVGKSSLVNALAGRAVAVVADEPGTTRDHVGVLIDLAGLVVRYLDTPGRMLVGAGPIEAGAAAIAARAAASADLILSCGDAGAPPIDPPPGRRALVIALRSDLGRPEWRADAAVSVLGEGRGIPELVALVRDTLVPPAALTDPRPWRFWENPGK